MDKLKFEPVVECAAVALYDVTDCVKSWGRRGIVGGGLAGFALGLAFVATPLTTNVLAFGVAGTLLVASMEGAVIAGAFGAFAAAFYARGAFRGRVSTTDPALPRGRRLPQVGWRDGDIPLAGWPTKWAYPTASAAHRRGET